MSELQLERTVLGETIYARVTAFDVGIHVSICGGQLSHIGAVSIVSPDGSIETTQFPGHKDGVISELWASALAQNGIFPAVVEAGIHYDNVNREQIAQIVAATDEMLRELLSLRQKEKI